MLKIRHEYFPYKHYTYDRKNLEKKLATLFDFTIFAISPVAPFLIIIWPIFRLLYTNGGLDYFGKSTIDYMKVKQTILSFFCIICLISCNKDESRFSATEIQNALFELKGTYHGEMKVSYYQGKVVSEGFECKVVSKDSLTINMDLTPMSSVIADKDIASRLCAIGVIQVKAAYEFLQMDNSTYHFVLFPDDVICLGGLGAPPTVKIVFSQIFGGDANSQYNQIIFNLSPIELWVGGKKYEPFQQLVYHFEGVYE